MHKNAIIYDNIISALENNIIQKNGNPVGWNDQAYRKTLWNGRFMITIGNTNQKNEDGIKVIVPKDYNMVWLRISNHLYNIYKIQYLDGDKRQLPKIAGGYRGLNEICPDGSSGDSYAREHIWLPIALPRSGELLIQSDYAQDHWISGIAFSQNLWNHAKQSAVGFLWTINGGSAINWRNGDDNWNNDVLGSMVTGKLHDLMVPYVYSGQDKILYIVEHNNFNNGGPHYQISVNGKPIERLRYSYTNPFATHFNSKQFMRYLAAKVPKEYLDKDNMIMHVQIDMTKQNDLMYFREIGTHDFI